MTEIIQKEMGTEMVINPTTVTLAKRNGQKSVTYHANGQSLTTDDVADLMAEKTSPAAQYGSRWLLDRMAWHPWLLEASSHRGGSGGDNTAHIRVEVGRHYHLRLDNQGCIFDITFRENGQTQRISGILPWTPP